MCDKLVQLFPAFRSQDVACGRSRWNRYEGHSSLCAQSFRPSCHFVTPLLLQPVIPDAPCLRWNRQLRLQRRPKRRHATSAERRLTRSRRSSPIGSRRSAERSGRARTGSFPSTSTGREDIQSPLGEMSVMPRGCGGLQETGVVAYNVGYH